MDNKLTPIEIDPEFESKIQQLTQVMNTPEQMNYMANKARQQIIDNLVQPVSDIPSINPNEKMEFLLEEQLKQYELMNNELQEQLEDAKLQLKQLNDKEASQNLYIKELKADLKEQSLKRELAEDKLSLKDWKVALVSGVIGLVTGIICAYLGIIL